MPSNVFFFKDLIHVFSYYYMDCKNVELTSPLWISQLSSPWGRMAANTMKYINTKIIKRLGNTILAVFSILYESSLDVIFANLSVVVDLIHAILSLSLPSSFVSSLLSGDSSVNSWAIWDLPTWKTKVYRTLKK